MAEPYLTKQQAVARLVDADTGFGISAEVADQITGGDLRLASDELDDMGPFKGSPLSESQDREWPRAGGFGSGIRGIFSGTPQSILDWVALRAFQLATEDEPAVSSEGAGGVSVSYALPKRSQLERRMERLLSPYLLKTGGRV